MRINVIINVVTLRHREEDVAKAIIETNRDNGKWKDVVTTKYSSSRWAQRQENPEKFLYGNS